MNTSDIIEVPVYFDSEAAPNCCLVNVERLVSQQGGEVVTGWIVHDHGEIAELVHHCCWRDSEDKLWTTTPQLKGIGRECGVAVLDAIQFVPDPDAQFSGEKPHRMALPNRYLANTTNPHVHEAIDYLQRSERAFYQERDRERGHYWTSRANKCMERSGIRIRFPPPDEALVQHTVGYQTL